MKLFNWRLMYNHDSKILTIITESLYMSIQQYSNSLILFK